jgi:hypothetical protein
MPFYSVYTSVEVAVNWISIGFFCASRQTITLQYNSLQFHCIWTVQLWTVKDVLSRPFSTSVFLYKRSLLFLKESSLGQLNLKRRQVSVDVSIAVVLWHRERATSTISLESVFLSSNKIKFNHIALLKIFMWHQKKNTINTYTTVFNLRGTANKTKDSLS